MVLSRPGSGGAREEGSGPQGGTHGEGVEDEC